MARLVLEDGNWLFSPGRHSHSLRLLKIFTLAADTASAEAKARQIYRRLLNSAMSIDLSLVVKVAIAGTKLKSSFGCYYSCSDQFGMLTSMKVEYCWNAFASSSTSYDPPHWLPKIKVRQSVPLNVHSHSWFVLSAWNVPTTMSSGQGMCDCAYHDPYNT